MRVILLLLSTDKMDPLQNLWDLYEAVQDKPPISPDDPSSISSVNQGNFDHPVIQQRTELDNLRAGGVPTGMAHEKVHGEVNLADVTQKSNLSATYGRVQDDNDKKSVHIDTKAEVPSMLAIDAELEKQSVLNPETLKTKIPKQTPTVDTAEEYDYNLDVQFLQTYGRA